jgi:hypothetical protein
MTDTRRMEQESYTSPKEYISHGFKFHSRYISHGLFYLDSKYFILLSMLGMGKYLWGDHELDMHTPTLVIKK